jgi:hypothetical protein
VKRKTAAPISRPNPHHVAPDRHESSVSVISAFRHRKSASRSHAAKKVSGMMSDFARLARFHRRGNDESVFEGALSFGGERDDE